MKRPQNINKQMESVIDAFSMARVTGDTEWEDRGGASLEKIIPKAGQKELIWNYRAGLAGIGCGIQYLLHENYVEGDADEVLRDFDFYLSSIADVARHTDLSKATGLLGIATYFLYRLNDKNAHEYNLQTLQIKSSLLNILHIVAAKLKMNGYSYLYENKESPLTEEEKRDMENFLSELYTFNIERAQIEEMLLRIKGNLPPSSSTTFEKSSTDALFSSLKDVTFVFPLRIDSRERLLNIRASLKYLLNNTDARFLVIEADTVQQGKDLEEMDERGTYYFYEDKDPVFYHTYYRNRLIRQASTPIVGVWDVDIIVPVSQIRMAADKIRSRQAVFALPYEGICYSVPEEDSDCFRRTEDEKMLFERKEQFSPMFGALTVGGAFIVDKEEYIKAGMENEYFYGWGPEDAERVERIILLNLPVYRAPGEIFHLWHPRGRNSYFPNKMQNIVSKQQYLKETYLSRQELANYIRRWPWLLPAPEIALTFIVPVYNVEQYLPQCIHSLLAQGIDRMEILLIDDGSTDRSGEIADEYARKDNRIRVIHQPNAGLSPARNRGLQEAGGQYIVFIDSDDWLMDGLKDMYETAVKYKAHIVMGNVLFWYTEEMQQVAYDRVPNAAKHTQLCGKEAFTILMRYASMPPMVYSYIYEREWLQSQKLSFHPVVHEDELWTPQALCLAERVVITDNNFYAYRQREGSIVRTVDRKRRIKALIYIANRLIRFAARYKFSREDEEVKSLLYVKIFELYNLAFKLLSAMEDSSFILPPHHLHCFYLIKQKLSPSSQTICLRYYLRAKSNWKAYLQWKLSLSMDNSPGNVIN